MEYVSRLNIRVVHKPGRDPTNVPASDNRDPRDSVFILGREVVNKSKCSVFEGAPVTLDPVWGSTRGQQLHKQEAIQPLRAFGEGFDLWEVDVLQIWP
ncbi:hypothetical protein ACJZ2D_001223 [Fusarium nematophilum]